MTAAETAYRTNDEEVERRNELVMSEISQVYYCAKRIRERLPKQVELEDLVQAGVLGLMDAAAKFDSTKDVKFATFAKFRINGAILDSLRKLDWCSRLLRRKHRAIQQASARISSEKGRAATHDEIATDVGITCAELHDTVTQLHSLQIVGQIAESSSEPGMTHDLIESAPDKGDNDPFDLCLRGENRALLIAALQLLSEREQMVIQLYYNEELTMREIAEVLGVVVSRVSQIHAEAIVKIRCSMEGSPAARPSPRVMHVIHRSAHNTAPVQRQA